MRSNNLLGSLLVGLASLGLVYATPHPRAAPTIQLDDATVVGTTTLLGTTNQFLGLRYAEPVNGTNRLKRPVANAPYTGTIDATSYGLSCPQQPGNSNNISALGPEIPAILDAIGLNLTELLSVINGVTSSSGEDCLFINVITPANVTPEDKLPVLMWIFGGGFSQGSPTPPLYNGNILVDKSIQMGSPIIYVSINYRLNGFGFLASEEVKAAGVGNLGLQDQRQALRWVQKYIKHFGGDPTKVTIWGASAGAISVALQMVTNNGNTEGLFHGAFMESGSPVPVGDISHGQKYYDSIVSETGCSGSADTLQCLRELEYETLYDAILQTSNLYDYQCLNLPWLPRVDGVFLTEPPQHLVQRGSVANIPFINGDNDDEGTLFTTTVLNITTHDEVNDYLVSNYVPNASPSLVAAVEAAYPDDPADGSPFNTSDLNAITPQFKRLAALQGDLIFQAPRRFFLQSRSGKQDIWTYDYKVLKVTPILGSFHGVEIYNIFFGGDMTPYLINFVSRFNPNSEGLVNWPAYTKEAPNQLVFQDDLLQPIVVGQDTYREEAFTLLTELTLANPI